MFELTALRIHQLDVPFDAVGPVVIDLDNDFCHTVTPFLKHPRTVNDLLHPHPDSPDDKSHSRDKNACHYVRHLQSPSLGIIPESKHLYLPLGSLPSMGRAHSQACDCDKSGAQPRRSVRGTR